jgi:hypothetical protein
VRECECVVVRSPPCPRAPRGVEAGEKRSQEVGGVSPVQGGSGRLTYVECNCCDHLMCEETVPTVPPTLTATVGRRVQITGSEGSVWAGPGALVPSLPSICSPGPPQPLATIVGDRVQCCTVGRAPTLTPNLRLRSMLRCTHVRQVCRHPPSPVGTRTVHMPGGLTPPASQH